MCIIRPWGIGAGADADMATKSQQFLLNACAWAAALGSVLSSSAIAATSLNEMSIEELAQVQVTSVSKHAQSLGDAPAAIYVIGDEDIRRSTATSLPEALRLAPNLFVQRMDAHQFTVSARGFSGPETSNKLLALIDGRTI